MTARLGRCLLLSSLALGCGGTTRQTIDGPGPPREGFGLYELTIERVSDDCKPALRVGKVGSVIVVVNGDAANVPFYDSVDPSIGPGRSDVVFDELLSIDIPIGVPPECGPASWHVEISVTTADSERIDVSYERVLAGITACSAVEEERDCTSERIFHFRWLHACKSGDVTECTQP